MSFPLSDNLPPRQSPFPASAVPICPPMAQLFGLGPHSSRLSRSDTSSLRIRNRYSLVGLTPLPGTIFSRPVEVLSLSNGKSMVRLRQPVSSEALLALWGRRVEFANRSDFYRPCTFPTGRGRPCPFRRSFESPRRCQRFQRGASPLRFGRQRRCWPAHARRRFNTENCGQLRR